MTFIINDRLITLADPIAALEKRNSKKKQAEALVLLHYATNCSINEQPEARKCINQKIMQVFYKCELTI